MECLRRAISRKARLCGRSWSSSRGGTATFPFKVFITNSLMALTWSALACCNRSRLTFWSASRNTLRKKGSCRRRRRTMVSSCQPTGQGVFIGLQGGFGDPVPTTAHVGQQALVGPPLRLRDFAHAFLARGRIQSFLDPVPGRATHRPGGNG